MNMDSSIVVIGGQTIGGPSFAARDDDFGRNRYFLVAQERSGFRNDNYRYCDKYKEEHNIHDDAYDESFAGGDEEGNVAVEFLKKGGRRCVEGCRDLAAGPFRSAAEGVDGVDDARQQQDPTIAHCNIEMLALVLKDEDAWHALQQSMRQYNGDKGSEHTRNNAALLLTNACVQQHLYRLLKDAFRQAVEQEGARAALLSASSSPIAKFRPEDVVAAKEERNDARSDGNIQRSGDDYEDEGQEDFFFLGGDTRRRQQQQYEEEGRQQQHQNHLAPISYKDIDLLEHRRSDIIGENRLLLVTPKGRTGEQLVRTNKPLPPISYGGTLLEQQRPEFSALDVDNDNEGVEAVMGGKSGQGLFAG